MQPILMMILPPTARTAGGRAPCSTSCDPKTLPMRPSRCKSRTSAATGALADALDYWYVPCCFGRRQKNTRGRPLARSHAGRARRGAVGRARRLSRRQRKEGRRHGANRRARRRRRILPHVRTQVGLPPADGRGGHLRRIHLPAARRRVLQRADGQRRAHGDGARRGATGAARSTT